METEWLRLEPYTVVPGACGSTHPSARRPDAVWGRLIKLNGKGLRFIEIRVTWISFSVDAREVMEVACRLGMQ